MAVFAVSVTLLAIPQASATEGMTWSQVPAVDGWNFHASNVNGSRSLTSPDDSIVIATTGPRTLIDFSSLLTTFTSDHGIECSDGCEIASNSDGSYLYAHTGVSSVYVSRNMGTTWTRVVEAVGGRSVAEVGATIAVSPDGSSLALTSYVDDPNNGFNGHWHVFYSSDFGNTFTDISSVAEATYNFFPNYKALLFTTNFDLYIANEDPQARDHLVYKASFPRRTTIQSGSLPNSQVATIPSGITTAIIPASSSLPATTLNFGGSVPDSVTVVPVASNPASASATPFTISGSTKIVDIQISGTFSGSATVCLDGAPTDHLYHFTGGVWVELASRTYVGGQVCGVTTSFSPFAAAPPAPVALVAAPVPDPVQQSKITALSVSTAIAGTPTPVEITGSFVEKIRAIQVNGVALPAGSWSQTASSVAFTMPAKAAGTYQIQLFNGSAPVLKAQNFTFTAPIVVVAPTPTPTAKPKVTYIRCAKPGHGTRIAYGVNPTCPTGYVKK